MRTSSTTGRSTTKIGRAQEQSGAMAAPDDDERWAMVTKCPNVGTQGVDWEAWEAQHPPPTSYAPPQLEIEYYTASLFKLQRCCSLCSSRSPWFSCCCGAPCLPCLLPGATVGDLNHPEPFLRELLRDEHPLTPDVLRGVFWFKDNVTAPETIVTLSDALWVSGTSGLKTQMYNWTRDYTFFGVIFTCFAARSKESAKDGYVRLELSPSGQWIWMTGDQLVYVVQAEDDLRDRDGSRLPPGTLMRLTYSDGDPKRALVYQYLWVPIARKDAGGKLVTTEALEQLRALANTRHSYRCGCPWPCPNIGCCLTDEEFLAATMDRSPQQLYIPAPQAMQRSGST